MFFLFLVIVSVFSIFYVHGVVTPALCECHPISLAMYDRTIVEPQDGICNSIRDAFDVHNVGTIRLK